MKRGFCVIEVENWFVRTFRYVSNKNISDHWLLLKFLFLILTENSERQVCV